MRSNWSKLASLTKPRKLDTSAVFSFMLVFMALKWHCAYHLETVGICELIYMKCQGLLSLNKNNNNNNNKNTVEHIGCR